MKKRVLTGINTTGTPHLGNYAGAIKPAILESLNEENDTYLFMANLHALIKCHDPKILYQSSLEIAATWLSLGLNPEKVVFYRQSDIPEIPKLNWIFNCVCPKGLMNRAHAYKAMLEQNEGVNDPDDGVSMGLFCYPVLMAADILMFNATHIPVGRDQIQHIEMTRDIAGRFNHRYKKLFNLPEAVISENVELLVGTDGRKMSKSYNNTIAIFLPEKQLRKEIMKIITTSEPPEAPKNPDTSNIFAMYKAFATAEQSQKMAEAYRAGISWADAKVALFELLNEELREPREKYLKLLEKPQEIEEILQEGAKKARKFATPFLEKIMATVGIKSF